MDNFLNLLVNNILKNENKQTKKNLYHNDWLYNMLGQN